MRTLLVRGSFVALFRRACMCLMIFAPIAHAAEPQVTEAMINAPIAEVWRVFTTSEGYRKLGVAEAEVDLKIGGLIRTHYEAGRLGDPQTIEQEILAYEPERMIATRVVKAPANFPHREAIAGTWSVIYFASIAGETTHVRLVGLGYDDSEASRAMRTFFEQGNRATLDHLVKQYRPSCASCEKPK